MMRRQQNVSAASSSSENLTKKTRHERSKSASTSKVEPWQHGKSEWWQQNEYLLSTGEYSDCTFVVGSKPQIKTFCCHRLLLAKCSAVFEAMLFGGLAEKNDIKVVDVKPKVFQFLLQFIYTGRVEMKDYKMALDLCLAADKYMLDPLKEFCIKKLTDDLSPQNVCQVYEVAKGLNLTELKEHSLKVLIERTGEVLASEEFLNASHDLVLLLVQQESLNITSETQLIQACLKWTKLEAKRKCLRDDKIEDLRKVLGSIFQHLRFLVLDHVEFATATENTNVLTDTEKCKLFFIVIKKDFTKIPVGFSEAITARTKCIVSVPQFIFSNCGIYSYNGNQTYYDPCYGNRVHTTSTTILNFKVNVDVYMTGFVGINYQPREPMTCKTWPFESFYLKDKAVLLETGDIRNGISIGVHFIYKYIFEKCVLLKKNELYSLTLISLNTQQVNIAMQQPTHGKNMYTDESIVFCAGAKNYLVGGIVYKKAN